MPEGMILTNAGRNLLARAIAGAKLNFTRAAIGDGEITTQDQTELTNLINLKKYLPIQSILKTESIGTCEVVMEMSNSGLSSGFFVREYGLFANDPDSGAEILYAYRNKGNQAGYLPGDNGIDAVNYTLTILTVIDQAQNVTATISTTNSYATISRLEGRVNGLFGEIRDAIGFWTYAYGDTQKLRPLDLQSTRDLIMGTTNIPSLVARVERLEDATAAQLLELEAQNIYPGYTHFIIEDFRVVNQIDTYTCDVVSVVAGDDSIDCTPLDGMYPGAWYSLTDGINTELVQVKSINLENGVQRVILTEPVQNTYFLGSCKLYRTSATIDNQQAYGAGTAKVIKWLPTLKWQGQGSQTQYEINPGTSLSNEQGFEISGDIVLTADGQITLEVA